MGIRPATDGESVRDLTGVSVMILIDQQESKITPDLKQKGPYSLPETFDICVERREKDPRPKRAFASRHMPSLSR